MVSPKENDSGRQRNETGSYNPGEIPRGISRATPRRISGQFFRKIPTEIANESLEES